MAWYRNISPKPQSVPTGDGNVVAVRPNDLVEVAAETEALRRLLRANSLVRAGRPVHALAPRAPYRAGEGIVMDPTPYAKALTEIMEIRVSPSKVGEGETAGEVSPDDSILQLDAKVGDSKKEKAKRRR